jgi:predicted Zn-dependent peptidase
MFLYWLLPLVLLQATQAPVTLEHIEGQVTRTTVGAVKVALLAGDRPDSMAVVDLRLRFGNEQSLRNQDVAADFAGQMLMRGTRTYSREALTRRFKELGAEVDISGDVYSAWASVRSPRAQVPAVLELVGTVLREPAFPVEEFDALKQETLTRVAGFKRTAQGVAARALGSMLNTETKGHPNYSGSIDESLSAIEAVTIDDARRFHREFYGASHGELTIVGDFDPTVALAAAHRMLGTWESPKPFERVGNRFKPITAGERTITVPGDGPAHMVGRLNLSVGEAHPDFPALLMGTYLLGHPAFPESRLARSVAALPDTRLSSILYASPLDPFGGFIVFADFPPTELARVESSFRDTLSALLTSGPMAEELDAARQHWRRSRESLRTDDKRLAGHLNTALFLGRTLTWDEALERRVAALRPADVATAMRTHIVPESISVVRAGRFPSASRSAQKRFADYEPSDAHPFGRPHPDAPPELSQFAFMIGEFDCTDTIRRPDGARIEFPAVWGARYFLNGYGIQDHYWSPTFSTSNIRIFDPDAGRWKITFFRMPGYQSGVWEGGLEGEQLVFRNNGRTSGPGLTFHNIRDNGFDWHSGGSQPGWTSSCTRRGSAEGGPR